MCLATVYVEEDGQREEVMRDVAWIEPKRDGLQMVTLIGESRLFQAEIKSINLMDSLIVLRRVKAESAPEAPAAGDRGGLRRGAGDGDDAGGRAERR